MSGVMKVASIDLPGDWELTRVVPVPAGEAVDPDTLLPPRSVKVPPGKTVVVVNDAQRPTPTPWLLARLDVDWRRADLVVAVASGSHIPPTEKELAEIFGELLGELRSRIVVNHATAGDFVAVGKTRRGTIVEIHRCLEGASSVICLNSLEPHYFAGWTGGRKSLVPGLCSLETMRLNHRLALQGGVPGAPARCPVHLDLEDGTRLVEGWLGRRRCALVGVNAVHHRGRFYGCFAGPLLDTVDALAPAAKEVFARRLAGLFPVVICRVDPPLDRDLYQALKAFENWKSAVAPGGVLILVAPCPAGIGPPSFRQFMVQSPSLETLLAKVGRDYSLGDHKLVSFLRYREEGKSVFLVAGKGLSAPAAALPVFSDLKEAVGAAVGRSRFKDRRLLLVEDAGHLFPVF
jgi:nickel-dependent lactate racemase